MRSAPLEERRAATPSNYDGILPELPGQPERPSRRNPQYQQADFRVPVRVVRDALAGQGAQAPRFRDAHKETGSRGIAPMR